MAETSKIAWTEATWNPITGCSMVSAGCTNCYAQHLAATRLRNHPSRKGLTKGTAHGYVWTGEVRFNAYWLDQPIRWQRPRRIFVVAHGDLFHENVPDKWIDDVFHVMDLAPHHVYQILTKRPRRMAYYVAARYGRRPAPHIWYGTSIENESVKQDRIEALLNTPAAVRWLSLEPLIGPVELTWRKTCGDCDRCLGGREDLCDLAYPVGYTAMLDWVVVGGESGKGARPMEHAWAERIVMDCREADVPVFVKQLSQSSDPITWKDYERFPEALRVREYPIVGTLGASGCPTTKQDTQKATSSA